MKQTFQLGVLSALNIGLTFLYQWYVLTRLGPGMETDALFVGMTVPQLVLAVVSASLMHVLVPILAGEDPARLMNDAWSLLILVAGFFGVLFVILCAGAPWWIPLTVPGFDDAGVALTIELTRIQAIVMVLVGINGVQWAAYHARQRFLWVEFVPVLAGAGGLLFLAWALPRYGITAAAWAIVLRRGAETLLLAPGMLGRAIRPDLRSPSIRRAWRRIKPLLAGTAYYKTDPLVDRFLLSMAGSGSLSLYYLAQQIYGAAGQVLNKAVTAPLVPLLSTCHKAGNQARFQRIYRGHVLWVGLIGLVGLIVLALFGRPLLGLLVGYGHIDAGDVTRLWWIMLWLAGMFLGAIMGQITSSSFYAMGDTVTITRISMITYTLYIPAKVIAFYVWGVVGLALATSGYYMANLSIQICMLVKKTVQ
jgi:putative peptidoglycan lipid II flippase